jgi:hypothetical protein
MNYPSSPAPGGACSERIYSDGAQSAMSSGTSIASESLLLVSATASCQPRQSSLTCVSSHSPVQPTSIEELRTWLQRAFPASHSQLPENSLPKATNETCGQQPRMSFAVFDRSESSWKTSQGSLLADTPESSSPIWPQWGMWDATDAYLAPIPALITSACGGGLWPTPLVRDARTLLGAARSENSLGTHPLAWEMAQREFSANGLSIQPKTRLHPEWVEWLQGFPTGWTALEPLGMRRFHEWLQQHGIYLADKEPA